MSTYTILEVDTNGEACPSCQRPIVFKHQRRSDGTSGFYRACETMRCLWDQVPDHEVRRLGLDTAPARPRGGGYKRSRVAAPASAAAALDATTLRDLDEKIRKQSALLLEVASMIRVLIERLPARRAATPPMDTSTQVDRVLDELTR